MSFGGGNNQLFSLSHLKEKASTPSEQRFAQRLLNLGNCLERKELNLSIVWGPHRISKAAKISGCNIKSSLSMLFEAKSAMMLSSLGTHSGNKFILLSIQRLKILKTILCKACFLLPLNKTRTTFWLSEWCLTTFPFSWSAKDAKTYNVALNSLYVELVLISLSEKEPFAMESLEETIYPPQASSEASE